MSNRYQSYFGIDFQIDELEINDLPLYLTSGRTFQKLSYGEIAFLLVRVSEDERFGVAALEKQAALLYSKYQIPVVFCFVNISKTQRDSLIKRNIPFIAEDEQMYLPFLGILLCERLSPAKRTKAEKMMPVTQALFLYMLYECRGSAIMKKDAAEAIGTTRTSITRASDQLEAMSLISQEMKGKEHYMTLQGSGMQLYEKAKPFLINPVQKIVTVQDEMKFKCYPLSGESALAEKTMLNDPAVPVRAVWKAKVKEEKLSEIDIRWEPEKKAVKLELWKYDPFLFMKKGIVDPVSLSMSFEKSVDERIEGAIEEYLEGYQW